MASTFAPHEFIPYPEGHVVKSTCIKCGRNKSHELHNVAKKETKNAEG